MEHWPRAITARFCSPEAASLYWCSWSPPQPATVPKPLCRRASNGPTRNYPHLLPQIRLPSQTTLPVKGTRHHSGLSLSSKFQFRASAQNYSSKEPHRLMEIKGHLPILILKTCLPQSLCVHSAPKHDPRVARMVCSCLRHTVNRCDK